MIKTFISGRLEKALHPVDSEKRYSLRPYPSVNTGGFVFLFVYTLYIDFFGCRPYYL